MSFRIFIFPVVSKLVYFIYDVYPDLLEPGLEGLNDGLLERIVVEGGTLL